VAAFLISLALATAGPADEPVPILVGGEGPACRVVIQGQRYALAADETRIAAHFGSLKRRHRRARLVLVEPDTPYRCVGGVIFQAQRAGLPLGFVAAPPPASR
jgi:hypothetical protein